MSANIEHIFHSPNKLVSQEMKSLQSPTTFDLWKACKIKVPGLQRHWIFLSHDLLLRRSHTPPASFLHPHQSLMMNVQKRKSHIMSGQAGKSLILSTETRKIHIFRLQTRKILILSPQTRKSLILDLNTCQNLRRILASQKVKTLTVADMTTFH